MLLLPMYNPAHFALDDAQLIAQITEENSFATLVSSGENGFQASHLPFEWDAERGVLRSHMARANPQWRDFAAGAQTLTIFAGAHGYISPRWYETELSVPTWNYLAVHMSGSARVLDDDGEAAQLLESLVARYERDFETPWKLTAPADWQQKLRRAIVAFEIRVTRIEAKAKMSQNRPVADILGAIEGLEATGSADLAVWMRRLNAEKLTGNQEQ